MPIQHAIWKVGENPQPLVASHLASEQKLEEMIVSDPRILSNEWMLIGRQELTSHGGRNDLLAIAPDGSLVLIELKRDQTPREIIAQALDYASWVEELEIDLLVILIAQWDREELEIIIQEKREAENQGSLH
jgi:RecB family endonuclease NucS